MVNVSKEASAIFSRAYNRFIVNLIEKAESAAAIGNVLGMEEVIWDAARTQYCFVSDEYPTEPDEKILTGIGWCPGYTQDLDRWEYPPDKVHALHKTARENFFNGNSFNVLAEIGAKTDISYEDFETLSHIYNYFKRQKDLQSPDDVQNKISQRDQTFLEIHNEYFGIQENAQPEKFAGGG